MITALVADDSKVDQRFVGRLLETRSDMRVIYADNGQQALELIDHHDPGIVLTDMQMPVLDGLALVEAVRRDFPHIPVVLITAHGSEEAAAEALRRGAASYVPKRYLSRDLAPTVERVMAISGIERHQQKARECLVSTESRFVLDNDPSRIYPLVRYVRQDVARLDLCDKTALMRVGVALDEALRNAIEHGNLEIAGRPGDMDEVAYQQLLTRRRQVQPYCDRHVELIVRVTREKAEFIVRDEGKGFNLASVTSLRDPQRIETGVGKGLLLIHNFMDEVRFNEFGNQVTMIKHHDHAA